MGEDRRYLCLMIILYVYIYTLWEIRLYEYVMYMMV